MANDETQYQQRVKRLPLPKNIKELLGIHEEEPGLDMHDMHVTSLVSRLKKPNKEGDTVFLGKPERSLLDSLWRQEYLAEFIEEPS